MAMTQASPTRTVTFRPQVFEVASLAEAKAISVTPEPGTTTEDRWVHETRYLVDDIGQWLSLGPESCVLDYGCGPGRVAKTLIDQYGCRVIGVDTSKAMRLLAPEYVLSERFLTWSPETLDQMIAQGFRADAAICLWVIQHALHPTVLIDRIHRALRPGAILYSLNQTTRCVPTDTGWINDGFDIRAGLCAAFAEEDLHQLPPTASSQQLSEITMIQVLRKRAAGLQTASA